MATVNIGSLKFNWKGAYNGSTAYAIDDVTEYNGSSYICILASTGNLPTNTTYFQPMATKGTDGTDVGTTLTTQGDILYRDGSGLQRLGAGTSGQFLKTQGTGANPVWADSGGKTLALTQATNNTRTTLTSVNSENNLMTGTHTQVKANSKLLVHYKFPSNSATASKPATIWNPNSTDNDRMSQTFSEIIILELDF